MASLALRITMRSEFLTCPWRPGSVWLLPTAQSHLSTYPYPSPHFRQPPLYSSNWPHSYLAQSLCTFCSLWLKLSSLCTPPPHSLLVKGILLPLFPFSARVLLFQRSLSWPPRTGPLPLNIILLCRAVISFCIMYWLVTLLIRICLPPAPTQILCSMRVRTTLVFTHHWTCGVYYSAWCVIRIQ